MILHQVEALANAGVTDIVLAVNYRPEIMTAALKQASGPAKASSADSQSLETSKQVS